MGKGPPDPPAELTTEKPAEHYKPIASFKAPPPPTIQPCELGGSYLFLLKLYFYCRKKHYTYSEGGKGI